MKTIVAFIAGAVLAGGIAFFALRKTGSSEPEQTAAVTQPAQPPAAQEAPPQPAAPPPSPIRSHEPAPVSRPVRVTKKQPAPSPDNVPSIPEKPAESTPAPAALATPQPAPPIAQTPPEPPTPHPQILRPETPPTPPEPNRVTLIAGTLIPVRLAQTLSSDRVQTGQTFQATLDQPLIVDGFVIAERGARVEGRVAEAEEAGRVKGVSHLALELTRINTSDGQRVTISTSPYAREGEQTRKSDAAKVAAGAGIGAALGAIFGGGKGAAIGAASGGAAGTGVVLTTRGKPVVLSAETRISFKLKAPVTITERR
ncbi:MAG: hypothetical protein IT167_02725 [Bryobacterales bacterium]|nr:hypothetical protein [Bryobacterales bacterium]